MYYYILLTDALFADPTDIDVTMLTLSQQSIQLGAEVKYTADVSVVVPEGDVIGKTHACLYIQFLCCCSPHWNELPTTLISCESLASFRKNLKTNIFKIAFLLI